MHAIRRYLKVLEDVGYVTAEKNPDNKTENIYKPLMDDEKKRTETDNSKFAAFTSSDFEKGFREWLSQYGQTGQFTIYTPGKENIPVDALQDHILVKDGVCPYFKKLFASVKSQNNAVEMANSQMSASVRSSDEKSGIDKFFQTCPLCHNPMHDTDASTYACMQTVTS